MSGLSSEVIFSNEEWSIVHRIAVAGDTWKPIARRNGIIMDVPQEPVLREEFKTKYPYSPVTDPNSNKVFIYRPVQLTIKGTMRHGDGPIVIMDNVVACAYPSDSFQNILKNTPILSFPTDGEGYCCMPKETMLMWNRSSKIMDANITYLVGDHKVNRTRLLLLKGSISVNDITYTGPVVININPLDCVKTYTKIYAIEVWI